MPDHNDGIALTSAAHPGSEALDISADALETIEIDLPDRFVYVLSTYGEHGAQHVTATLDRSKITDLIASWSGVDDAWKREAITSLNAELPYPDQDLAVCDGINLHDAWGGLQLHVVRLVP